MNAYPDIAEVFNASHYARVDLLARTLRSGSFRKKHFEEAAGLINHTVLGIKDIWQGFPFLDKLVPEYMPHIFYAYNQPFGHYSQPGVFGLAAGQNIFVYHESLFPVFIDLPHVRKRHAQRASSAFGINEMNRLLGIAMVFAKTLDNTQPLSLETRMQSESGVPLLLPDKQGLYLCSAKRITAAEQDGSIHIVRRRDENGYLVQDPRPPVSPRVAIFVGSYVAYKNMTPTKERIYKLFRELIDDPVMQNAINVIWINHMMPMIAAENKGRTWVNERTTSSHRSGEAKYDELMARIRKMINRPEWEMLFFKNETVDLRIAGVMKPRNLPILPCMSDEWTTFNPQPRSLRPDRLIGEMPDLSAILPASLKRAMQTETPPKALPGLGQPLKPADKPFSFQVKRTGLGSG